MEENNPTSLPENAYRELKPGEEYTPLMPAASTPREVTPYSVTMGVIMAVVFSAAAAFLGLKVGQVFEAAIPIAIIAVGMGNVLGKKNMLGQNVIIQSIGASSGVIVAGAIFTLPALYILGLDAAFWQVFLSSLFGGLLGIVLLIPFRKYFVKEMHGKYPFPEATATTEVLVSGEKGGSQAKLLAAAGLIGGLYDFVVGTFGLWTESVSTRICSWGAMAAEKFKVVFSVNTSAAVLGLGYHYIIRGSRWLPENFRVSKGLTEHSMKNVPLTLEERCEVGNLCLTKGFEAAVGYIKHVERARERQSRKIITYAFLSKEVPGRFVYCPQLYCRADDAIDKRLRIFKTIRGVLEETNGRVVVSTECELDGEYRPTNVKENTITADFSRPIRVPMGEQIIRDGPEPPYRPYKKAPKKAKPHKRRNPAPTR